METEQVGAFVVAALALSIPAAVLLITLMDSANRRAVRRVEWLLPVRGRWAVYLVGSGAMLVLIAGVLSCLWWSR